MRRPNMRPDADDPGLGGVPEQGLRDLQREMETPEGVERIKAELARGFANAERMAAAIEKARKVSAEFLRKEITI